MNTPVDLLRLHRNDGDDRVAQRLAEWAQVLSILQVKQVNMNALLRT